MNLILLLSPITTLTFRTLRQPEFLKLILKTALFTLLGFTLFLMVMGAIARGFIDHEHAAVEGIFDIGATIGISMLGWMLLPALLPLIAMFFQDSIADKIEAIDYPDSHPPQVVRSWYKEFWQESKFMLVLVVVTLFSLPFLFLFPPAYYIVGGYLLGREFFENVAARHLGKREARTFRRQHRWKVFLAGLSIIFLTNVPFLNLAAPFVGVAIMVHLFHRLHTVFVPTATRPNNEWALPELIGKRPTRFVRPAESYQEKIPESGSPWAASSGHFDAPSSPPPAYGKYEPVTPKQVERGTKANQSHTIPDAGNRALPTGKRYAEKYSHVVKKDKK